MATYDIFGPQTRKPGVDGVITLYDTTGNKYTITADDTSGAVIVAKNGTTAALGLGAGGAVTQITSASTGVTLNTVRGQITTVALTTAAAAEEVFVVTNSSVAAADIVAVSTTYAGGGTPIVSVKGVAAGSFSVVISNLHASAALDAVLVVNFTVLKGATS